MKKERSREEIAFKKENVRNEAQDVNDRCFDQTTANRSYHGDSPSNGHQVMLLTSCALLYLDFTDVARQGTEPVWERQGILLVAENVVPSAY